MLSRLVFGNFFILMKLGTLIARCDKCASPAHLHYNNLHSINYISAKWIT